jgi:hypothetical protein
MGDFGGELFFTNDPDSSVFYILPASQSKDPGDLVSSGDGIFLRHSVLGLFFAVDFPEGFEEDAPSGKDLPPSSGLAPPAPHSSPSTSSVLWEENYLPAQGLSISGLCLFFLFLPSHN